jgi:hypothetical protein
MEEYIDKVFDTISLESIVKKEKEICIDLNLYKIINKIKKSDALIINIEGLNINSFQIEKLESKFIKDQYQPYFYRLPICPISLNHIKKTIAIPPSFIIYSKYHLFKLINDKDELIDPSTREIVNINNIFTIDIDNVEQLISILNKLEFAKQYLRGFRFKSVYDNYNDIIEYLETNYNNKIISIGLVNDRPLTYNKNEIFKDISISNGVLKTNRYINCIFDNVTFTNVTFCCSTQFIDCKFINVIFDSLNMPHNMPHFFKSSGNIIIKNYFNYHDNKIKDEKIIKETFKDMLFNGDITLF